MEEFFALKQAGGAGGSLSCSVLPGLSEPCNYCVSSVHLLRWVAPLQLSAAARVSSAGEGAPHLHPTLCCWRKRELPASSSPQLACLPEHLKGGNQPCSLLTWCRCPVVQ